MKLSEQRMAEAEEHESKAAQFPPNTFERIWHEQRAESLIEAAAKFEAKGL